MADSDGGPNNLALPRVPPRVGWLARPGFGPEKVTTWMRSTAWQWFPAPPEPEATGGIVPCSVGIGS